MSLNRELSMKEVRVWGLAIVFTVGGLFIVGKSVYELANSMKASGWPTADGSITHSNMKSKESYRARFKTKSSTHDVHLRYRYEVDGKEYTGRRITFGQIDRSSLSDAKGYLAKYPVGRNVQIHYDPDNPGDSVLESSAPGMTWMGILLGGLMFVGGGWGINKLAKSDKSKPRVRGQSQGQGRDRGRGHGMVETGRATLNEADGERDAAADALDHLG